MTNSLPIIDLAGFADSAGRAAKIARQIDEACRTHGFFFIENHGVPRFVIDAAFEAAAQFFAAPLSEKQKIDIKNSPCHRGWFGQGDEALDMVLQPQGDHKEGLKIGRDLPPDHARIKAGLALHGANQWPHQAGFKTAMQNCYNAFEQVSRQLMQAFALARGLEADYFAPVLRLPMATLGPLYYPALKEIGKNQLSAGAHTDFGCLTLLAQRDIAGLEIARGDGTWLEIPADNNRLVVNIGDMLARWTNDIYRSTRHRVINRGGQTRYALAYFFDPDPEADLSPLPGCLAHGQKPHYPPTTCLAHLLDKIDESFSYHTATQIKSE